MSGSDPIMFAAKAANMSDGQLHAELQRLEGSAETAEWRQALQDELALREQQRPRLQN